MPVPQPIKESKELKRTIPPEAIAELAMLRSERGAINSDIAQKTSSSKSMEPINLPFSRPVLHLPRTVALRGDGAKKQTDE